MQPVSPQPAVAIEGDDDHAQIHNDTRALLLELAGANLQTAEEVNGTLDNGWVFRLVYNTSTSSYPARSPVAAYHDYVGPVQPTGMVVGDTWADTSAS